MSLRKELEESWRQMPCKGLFGVLLLCWIGLFHWQGNSTFGYITSPSLFAWLLNDYSKNADDAHGQLIPFVVLALMWMKRRELIASAKGAWWPALFGVGAGLALHLVAYLIQQPRLSALGFFVGLYFLMGLAWGWSWLKTCFFPYFLFVFCLPTAGLAEPITFPLRLLVTSISTWVSQTVLGINVVRIGTQLFNAAGTFQYDVAAACSGIRSLMALFALTTIYAFLTFNRNWKRLLIIFAAVPLAVIGNVGRIIGVILVAEAFGEKAGLAFHDWFGFVSFAAALVGVLALGYWLRDRALASNTTVNALETGTPRGAPNL